MVERGKNKDWIDTGKYGGLSIDVLVRCSRDKFLNDYPKYKDEPFVIVQCPERPGHFREQTLLDGQTIWCTDKVTGSTQQESKGTRGVIGYWVAEPGRENTYLGITAFHVLDSVTAERGYNGDDEKDFAMHSHVLQERLLEGRKYRLGRCNGNILQCSFVCGLFDESLDVGVVRCTDTVGAPSSTGQRLVSSFKWPGILHTLVVEMERNLKDIILDYECSILGGGDLSIYHNGKTEGGERKVGKRPELNEQVFLDPTNCLRSDTIRVVADYGEHEEWLTVEGLGDLLKFYVEQDKTEDRGADEVASGEDEQPLGEDAGEDEEAGEVASGEDEEDGEDADEDEEAGEVASGEDEEDGEDADEDEEVGEVASGEDEEDGEDADEDEEAGEVGNENESQDDSGYEERVASALLFTRGGDSGCVYYVKIELPNERGVMDAPIGIHRGVYNESLSCASDIVKSLQSLYEIGFNLWFTIEDEDVVTLSQTARWRGAHTSMASNDRMNRLVGRCDHWATDFELEVNHLVVGLIVDMNSMIFLGNNT